jgi:hypothetical protein
LRIFYDGAEHGILNLNNDRLFTHSIFNDFISAFTSSEEPFHAYVRQLSEKYHQAKSSIEFCSQKLFQAGFYSFINLQQWRYKYSCPKCGDEPEVVICDGVHMAFPKSYLSETNPTSTYMTNNIAHYTGLHYLNKLSAKHLNTLRLTTGRLYRKDDENEFNKPVNEDDFSALLEALKSEYPEISDILRVISTKQADDTSCFTLRRLIRTLSCKDPIYNLARIQLINIIKSILESGSVSLSSDEKQNLQVFSPLLFDVVSLRCSILLKPIIDNFLHSLLSKAESVFNQIGHSDTSVQDIPHDEQVADNDVFLNTGQYFGTKQKRVLANYTNLYQRDKAKATKCHKDSLHTRDLTGGTMIFWCPHRIAVGFHVIPSGEGRIDVFSGIFSRWTRAPKIIVYDFACALQYYCLIREFAFFAETIFLHDTLHDRNHVHCSESFTLRKYKLSGHPWFVFMNDSAAESGNSGLRKMKSICRYTTKQHFMILVRLQLEIQNRRRIKALYFS